ncbi:GNAT family N-acetyltransferase [Paeniglutamicibacter psychrophenolicus]|uniref:GNAT family N-acetyltransferase n=1 Tax=Paeniglutamicibacter psychrophenolicus TaxID=257454 RepID=UPI002788D15E|nr:GNAT family N-acetyltransferase [Paeniglutamicibacter psychrophenolicus]MDQ0094556.1 putative acetyltransferase [Paeniglutamicibacter psychrophenolicus]
MLGGHLRLGNVAAERGADTGAASPGYAAWVKAVWEGFYHYKPATAEQLEQMLQSHQVDERVLTAVWDDSRPRDLVDPLVPVATYGTFAKTLNLGAAVVPAHLVTAVTVRPTHRRRGILRELMSADLARAKDAGYPVAALTASEATIYGRFGFGRATEAQTLHLDVRGDVRFHAPATGSMVQLAPEKLAPIAPAVFERFHAARRGSVGRQEAYLRHATGAWGEEGPEPEPKLRAAVYLDGSGDIQGYVTYVFGGWDPKPITLKVRDLVAATEVARREIFRFLAGFDLIESVSCPFAAANDPLPWALEDPARVRFSEREHGLWVRVLDVPAAFEAREYRGTGSFTLAVTDPQGLAAGRYGFDIREGRASVSTLAEGSPADATCGVVALAPLLLGSVGTAELVAAGLLEPASPARADELAALLDIPGVPHAINGF